MAWNLEVGELVIKKDSDSESLFPVEELNSYVKAEGLKEEAKALIGGPFEGPLEEEYSTPGLFVQVSGSNVSINYSNYCGSGITDACSCTTSACRWKLDV